MKYKTLFPIGLLLVCAAVKTHAATLHDNGEPDYTSTLPLVTSDRFSQTGAPTPILADDFTLPQRALIDGITFFGAYAPNDTLVEEVDARLTVEIRTDAGGVPGDLLGNSEMRITRTDTGQQTLGIRVYKYAVEVVPAIETPGAGTYWLVVYGDTELEDDGDSWTWAPARRPGNYARTFDQLETWTPHPALELAWSVSGTMSIPMNPGVNDAWYNPDTSGQGFFINVFPDAGIVFLAWFTYDVERPPGNLPAVVGEPGHRWVTAQGAITGGKVTMEISNTSGGVFDNENFPPTREAVGTIELSFDSCNSGTVEYDIPLAGVSGMVPIRRVVSDNVALCEALIAAPASPP